MNQITKIDLFKCVIGFHNYPEEKDKNQWDWRFCTICNKSQMLIKTYYWGPENPMTGKFPRLEWRNIKYKKELINE